MGIFLCIAMYSCLASGMHLTSETNTNDSISENRITTDFNMDYLTDSRGWRLHKMVSDKSCDMNNDGVAHTDILAEIPSCLLDDVLHLNTDHKAHYNRGLRCGDEPNNNAYDWRLINQKLIMTQDAHETMMYIVSVDNKKLVMTMSMESMGIAYLFNMTFIH